MLRRAMLALAVLMLVVGLLVYTVPPLHYRLVYTLLHHPVCNGLYAEASGALGVCLEPGRPYSLEELCHGLGVCGFSLDLRAHLLSPRDIHAMGEPRILKAEGDCNETPTRHYWVVLRKETLREPIRETIRLSSVANATVKGERLITAYRAIGYCIDYVEPEKGVFRVTGALEALIETNKTRLEIHEVTVKVDKKKFEEELIREWLWNIRRRSMAPRIEEEELNETLRVEWRTATRRVASVTVGLEVPTIHTPRVITGYPYTYTREVLAPLVKLLANLTHTPLYEIIRAEHWIAEYNDSMLLDDYPPNWIVFGGVCRHYGLLPSLLAVYLGLDNVLYLEIDKTPGNGEPHASAVYCAIKPIPYRGTCYGLLVVKETSNKTLVCWLLSDTGYSTTIWSKLPELPTKVYRVNEWNLVYRVIKTWVGCRAPPLNSTGSTSS